MLLDAVTNEPVVPNGSLGFHYGDAGAGRWNLDLGDVTPALTLHGTGEPVEVLLPRFDEPSGPARRCAAACPRAR